MVTSVTTSPRPKARPGPEKRLPADRRGVRARGPWQVGETSPRQEVNFLRTIFGAVKRGTPVGAIVGALAPSRLAVSDASLMSEEDVRAIERDYEDWLVENSEQPEVGPQPEGFRVLPNRRGIEFFPSAEPDHFVPRRLPLELPEFDFDTIPAPQQAPVPLPEQLPMPSPPQVGPPNRPAVLPQPAQELQFEFRPDGMVRIRTRPLPRRWNRRRRDTKLKRWYVMALSVINKTWGTVDEARQMAEAISWNTYTKDGRLAMHATNGSQLEVFQGIGRGEFDVDMPGAIMDFAINQAMDLGIGLANRYGYQGSGPIGIQSGPWDNPGDIEGKNYELQQALEEYF